MGMDTAKGRARAWAVIDAIVAEAGCHKHTVFFSHLASCRTPECKLKQDAPSPCSEAGKAARGAIARVLRRRGLASRTEVARVLRTTTGCVDRLVSPGGCRKEGSRSAVQRRLERVGNEVARSLDPKPKPPPEPFTGCAPPVTRGGAAAREEVRS